MRVTSKKRLSILLAAAVCVAVLNVPSINAAQGVPMSEISTLAQDLDNVEVQISQMRDRDPGLASTLQREADDLREYVSYLRVKARREDYVSRNEYVDVRERIDRLRQRAREGSAPLRGSESVRGRRAGEIPEGAEVDVRLRTHLNSGTARVEDRFEATTVVDVQDGSRVLVPAGSVMRGVVSSVDRASRTDRTGSLKLTFEEIIIDGMRYPIRATVTQALESEGIEGELGRVGAGSAVGGIIGGLIGGFKGALTGILIGAGSVIAAVPGKDVDLPPGTVLRVRFDEPLYVGTD